MTARDDTPGHPARPRDLDLLAVRARTGGGADRDTLLRAIRPLVFRWAWMRTADTDEAEDVTQAVLLRVHERIHEFEGRSSFSSWLYRITANSAAEMHRRKGVWRRLADRVRASGRPDRHAPDPVDRIEGARIRGRVARIIESLPGRQRIAIDLVDLQEFTPAEAADMLEMNPTTLRVHLLRARRTVRRRLLDEANEPAELELSHDR